MAMKTTKCLESQHKAFIEKHKIGEIIDGFLVIGKNNGGGVYLNGLTSLEPSTTFANGGGVYLNGLTSLEPSTTFANGGGVYLNGLTSLDANKDCFKNWGIVRLKYKEIPAAKTMQNNSNDKFICCDGIFTEVLKTGRCFWKLKKQGGKKDVCFLVTDGNGLYAHGNSIKEAKADLMYKINGNESKEIYRDLTFDSVLSLSDAIRCYRVITGACFFGVKNFVESNGLEDTKEISISKIVEITKNNYGGECFKEFFATHACEGDSAKTNGLMQRKYGVSGF
jgi:hypothetical protein